MTSRIGSYIGGGNWKHEHGTAQYGRNFSVKWLKVYPVTKLFLLINSHFSEFWVYLVLLYAIESITFSPSLAHATESKGDAFINHAVT